MARSWRDYGEAKAPCDNSDNTDNRGSEGPFAGAFVPIVPFVTALPAPIVSGLDALKSMAAPRLQCPERWPRVVSDALRLARDGWAGKAPALGWSVADLFGAVPDAHGDPYSDGLAVWLAGRKLQAISATTATVEDGPGRAFYNRREQVGAKLLWELGR